MPIPEALATALIGGAAALGSGAIGAGSAAMANRRAYKWSKKYFDYQNQYNLMNYSPAQNMERLRQAGINPHEVSGSPGSGMSMQGSMSVPDYQNPVDPLAKSLPAAVEQAFNMYTQRKNLENQSELVKSQIERNTAEAAKTNYQVANILPHEAAFARNKRVIPLYQAQAYSLQARKMMQDISLFSMQKQKFQLGLDLLELQKQYQDEYYKYRNKLVRNQASKYGADAAMGWLDVHNYQEYGIRPNDPFYARFAGNVVDAASKPGFLKRGWNRLKSWWYNPFNHK